ncbi:sensor histidine kinase [Methanosalsum natronophilum]|uniref:Sensor histidine kinase n=2 Tax=Methanosalsum natronophilum TaxID=768733 RepID=A0A3R7X616_9EURY|nr:MAG: sensor histidine kinase [Methanosalsum natronophilum]
MRHISQMNSSVNVPVDLEVDVDELYLNMDITIPLGMIINEIVTNSFKHAFDGKDKGHISISFKENDDGYELVVKDDGIGIPESLEQMNFNTLGLKVINLLVTQLQGDLRLDNLDGTCYTISIPKEV